MGDKSSTGRSKYKCGICGQPKKGHICQAAGGTMYVAQRACVVALQRGPCNVGPPRGRRIARTARAAGSGGVQPLCASVQPLASRVAACPGPQPSAQTVRSTSASLLRRTVRRGQLTAGCAWCCLCLAELRRATRM